MPEEHGLERILGRGDTEGLGGLCPIDGLPQLDEPVSRERGDLQAECLPDDRQELTAVPHLESESRGQDTTELRLQGGLVGDEGRVHEDDHLAGTLAGRRAPTVLARHALDDPRARIAIVDLDEVGREVSGRDADVGKGPGAEPHLLVDLRRGRRHPVEHGVVKAAQIADDAFQEYPELPVLRVVESIHADPPNRRPPGPPASS